jgi:hypothetical protein
MVDLQIKLNMSTVTGRFDTENNDWSLDREYNFKKTVNKVAHEHADEKRQSTNSSVSSESNNISKLASNEIIKTELVENQEKIKSSILDNEFISKFFVHPEPLTTGYARNDLLPSYGNRNKLNIHVKCNIF